MSGFILELDAQMTSSSKIVFGSMRMYAARQGIKDWANLLLHAQSLGVLRIHCSDEYESFPFLLAVLEEVRRSSPQLEFRFIVKLAEPHFGENVFDAKNLLTRIDAYREALQTDQLDCIQWMWRGNLEDETGRIRGFSESANRILEVVDQAKYLGKIKSFHCFPYTFEFAQQALEAPFVDGLTIYRNPLEIKYDPLLARAQAIGKRVLVIRPFKAGEALADIGVANLIKFSANSPAVDGIVVSCSSIKHLEECVQAATLC
jgi:aryl-alcohol dehydrogenase-like predicted oxidoreductase